jgi:ribosomal protein S3AE
MREQYRDFLASEAKKQNLGEFINNVLFNRIGGKCKRAMSKVYPIRHAIIQKTEMVGEKYVPAVAAAKAEEKPAEGPVEEPKAEAPEEAAEPEPAEEEPEAEEK